ncbi:hypothetical protein B5X24_HaOG202328 [Helicoverpa armigera]|uniref:Reverse transcriptase domain-containing protein n=1 Tax=Helicoverpa armigera TaxID=29058 RepID=A0A2W1BZV1_HELAM|nr:hypothetical protein B5X24_HaOG202328 [Helicoverpa armigera]
MGSQGVYGVPNIIFRDPSQPLLLVVHPAKQQTRLWRPTHQPCTGPAWWDTVQTPMSYTPTVRPQVPGGPSGRAVSDGSQPGAGTRGVYNLRAGSIPRQTTPANVSLDTESLNVLTYNVRTLLKNERLVELENSLKDIRWDIIGLSEVRRDGELTEERDDNIFFHVGTDNGLHGVGFLVSKKWKNNIIEFRGYSERVAVIKFRLTNTKTLTLVQTYAPTSAYSDDEVEDYYDLLNKACDDNRGTFNMVLGDFNAKIGARQHQDDGKIIGPHGLGTRNERGSRLLQFAFGQMLSISNTFFTKKPQRRWTWISPDGKTRNEIDFILSSCKYIVKDVGIINKIKFSSDHRPLRAKLTFNFKIHRQHLFRNRIKTLNKQIILGNYEDFELELKNSFSLLHNSIGDAQKQYDTILESIRTATNKIKIKRPKTNKLTHNTLILIDRRRDSVRQTDEYRELDKRVKRNIRKDLRNHSTKSIKIALERGGSLRSAKDGISKNKTWLTCLRDRDGIKQYSREKISHICTDFFKTLYADSSRLSEPIEYLRPDISPIIGGEVDVALKSLKYNKSPGDDGISTEILKLFKNTLIPHITNLFNSILFTGQIPLQFTHSNIIILHKKGDKTDINNYRPISLISHLYKLFIKVIHNRIREHLDQHQPIEQAGFRPSFSTTDHLFTLNQIIEKYNEYHKPLYLAFVDYSKAFDSLKHTAIFTSLRAQNVNETYIKLLELIYRASTASVKLLSPGPTFHIEKGVKQGDPLSPNLFTCTLEEVFKKLTVPWTSKGIAIGSKRLTNLRFADDIVLFASTSEELQQMLQDLSMASREVGLQMNMNKTQTMTNSTKRRVEVDGQALHYVDEYIYMGQLVSFENRKQREIDRRIENAWKSYWSMKHYMKGDLPLSLKRKLVDMCILPVLTYGAQTWSLTECQKSKLKVCQRAMERSLLGIKRTDRIRNTVIRSRTGVADVGQKAATLKWNWAGHVSRMHPERWATIITQWTPQDGHRRRGRPRKRWRDEIDAYRPDWWTRSKDREEWKRDGEAFAQQWDTTG